MKKSDSLLTSIIALLLGIAIVASCRITPGDFAGKSAFLAPPQDIEHFTLGYHETVADSLWLRLIQDIDHCEKKDASATDDPAKPCETQLGWVYQMVDAITKIAPKFEMMYLGAATILSVVVHDDEGAKRIFERGIAEFPNDWVLLYRASFHYMERLKDTERAAQLLQQAGRSGAPPWVFSLSAKLYTAEGKAFLAKSVLESVLADNPDERWVPTLKKRLEEVDATLKAARANPEKSPEKSMESKQ